MKHKQKLKKKLFMKDKAKIDKEKFKENIILKN